MTMKGGGMHGADWDWGGTNSLTGGDDAPTAPTIQSSKIQIQG